MRRLLWVLVIALAVVACGEGLIDSNGVPIAAPDAGCDGGYSYRESDGGCPERDH